MIRSMLALVRGSSFVTEGEDLSSIEGATPTFEAVYVNQFEYVWRTARRLGVRRHEIDDVVQDVFLMVHRLLPRYRPEGALRGWLYAIVVRTVMHHRRTRRRRTAPLENGLDDELVDQYPDEGALGPEASAVEREHLRLLHRLLDGLDSDKRAVVVLAAFEHKSTAEIANILALNPKTVASRLRAAREQIQAALECHKARDTWRIK